MPNRRACVLNQSLQERYPFIKLSRPDSKSDVFCSICKADLNIPHSGKLDIERHLKSDKHKSCVSSSKQITNFFKSAEPSKYDLKISACEGVWAYHIISGSHSFRSSDCASKVIRRCFKLEKFSCVFAPYVMEQMAKELDKCHFVSSLTDASNHGNIKMFPVLVRYFLPTEGVKVRILQLTSEKNETSDTIVALIKDALKNFKLEQKLIGFCADNTNTNFGGVRRGGENNFFYKLKLTYPNLVGVGCAAHIVHNAMQAACNGMPFDVEATVVRIYSHFYIFTVRVTDLKSFCESVDEEYQNILAYGKTRFLSMLPAIDSILRIFNGLKKYFNETANSPQMLKQFFNDDLSKLWLLFLRDQASIFRKTVLKLESDTISAIEVGATLTEFMENIKLRESNRFLSIAVLNEIDELNARGIKITKDLVLMTTTDLGKMQ